MLYHVQIRTLSRQQLGLDTIPLEEGEGVLAVVDSAQRVGFFNIGSRPQRWSIIQGDGMVNVFSLGHHCRQWFFNGFDTVGPSPLNVFWGSNHWNQWFFDGFQNFEGNGQQWF